MANDVHRRRIGSSALALARSTCAPPSVGNPEPDRSERVAYDRAVNLIDRLLTDQRKDVRLKTDDPSVPALIIPAILERLVAGARRLFERRNSWTRFGFDALRLPVDRLLTILDLTPQDSRCDARLGERDIVERSKSKSVRRPRCWTRKIQARAPV